MNTPAHAILNLALLTGGRRRTLAGPVLAGALVPDLPMFAFYLYQRFALVASESQIWNHAYFESAWQDLFDVFNSIPLALMGLAVCVWLRRRAAAAFFASGVLHCVFDLTLHREDAHRHFLPLSDWHFVSPISYWDPAHYGALASFGELITVMVGSFVLWRRYPRRGVRALLAGLCVMYAIGWGVFYGAGQLQTSSITEISPGTPTRSGKP